MRTVTLITGDTVLVSGDAAGTVVVRRGPGREHLAFVTRRVTAQGSRASHLFVIPEDAVPLLASGKVDRRLFDVTRLLEYGYDDVQRDSLPLIVTYERGSAPLPASARAPGRGLAAAVVERSLASVNGVSLVSAKANVAALWRAVAAAPTPAAAARAAEAPIAKIWLDGLLQPVLDRSAAQIGAPEAWAAGYEGDGVIVAVLDSGVDDTHPDLEGRVIASRNFTPEPDTDLIGHGTHVASIIAGSGAASGGLYRGVAPGADLLAGKVCEVFGCLESAIIAGMEWAIAEEGARIVNMSLSGLDTPGYDPIEEAVSTFTAQYGALFVLSAGNSGPFAGSIESPGSIAAGLTVGAMDRDDQVALFSSRGPTLDLALKPDLMGPGVDIVAARASGTELGPLVGEDYAAASGTSMATPHVAGAAALLLQRHPFWGAAELKSALIGSGAWSAGFAALEQGGGRVDVAAALDTTLLASVPSLGLGVARWPHEDDAPIARSISLRNLGAAAQVALALDIVGPDGAPVPSDMFRVEPSLLELPAGGSASVRVTVDTRQGSADGVYSGRLVASDDAGQVLGIPLAVERERESYDLTLRHLDREGAPSQLFATFVTGFDPFVYLVISDIPGVDEQTFRVPKGQYLLETQIFNLNLVGPHTYLVTPNLELDADTLLELDARLATPVEPLIAIAEATSAYTMLNYEVPLRSGLVASSISTAAGTPAYYSGVLGAAQPELVAVVQSVWRDASASPSSLWSGAWTSRERLPEGRLEVDLDRLATVHAHYARSLGTALPFNELAVAPFLPRHFTAFTATTTEFPHDRVEHFFSPDPAIRWLTANWAHDEAFALNYLIESAPSHYRARRTYEARYNEPPFQILAPEVFTYVPWVYRERDQLVVLPPIYSDGGGHNGYFVTNEGRTRLYRDGELIGDHASGEGFQFEVPPEPARYRFELDTAQPLFELTTEQRLVWTFDSERPAEGERALPSLLTVRFMPALDASGRAPRGRFRLPVEVARYGEGTDEVSPPRVEVSYDDGASWLPARVHRRGTRYEALLEHPREGGYVSLRASANDAEGAEVEHTVTRAYALEEPR